MKREANRAASRWASGWWGVVCGLLCAARAGAGPAPDPAVLTGKVMAGYQGWFRCPGDAMGIGWVHWSRARDRIAPETLTVEMWPDLREYRPAQRYLAPGFTHPDGTPAALFSSMDAESVRLHFQWMKQYGIDGAWLQRFVVGLPGGSMAHEYPSHLAVTDNVRAAAAATGRVWALAYDLAAAPRDLTLKLLTEDWVRTVDAGVTGDPRYVHQGGRPVVLIWGFYRDHTSVHMDPDLANQLLDFLGSDGPYQAWVVGGGDWDWRRHDDPQWRACLERLGGYCPWNVGNYTRDADGTQRASTQTWATDRDTLAAAGVQWVPVIYPGFGWDNLTHQAPGTSTIDRRRGEFLWEQFVTLAKMRQQSAYLAMFDEVDEGTALFKVSDTPPPQGHFDTLQGMPSDWYLRVTQAGVQMLRGQRPLSEALPLRRPKATQP
jgi:hypothetical protein